MRMIERIHDGDYIMVDASSTAIYVIRCIKHLKNITLITNSVEILLELADKQDWNVLSTGGALKKGGLSSEEKKNVKQQMDSLVEEFGSKAGLNKYLEVYTMDYDLLYDYYELYALYNKGMTLAFSEGGEHEIPIEDAKEYYKNNFVTVKHIAIGTEFSGTDEDGNFIYYTEEEKALKQQNIQRIKEALENGEDFEKYIVYSEDKFTDTYPDGYTITRGVLTDTMAGYESVAFSLAEGEWDMFELEDMGVYFIKRVPLLESDFQNCYTNIMTNLVKARMVQTVLDEEENFVKNEELIDSYNMAMLPTLN